MISQPAHVISQLRGCGVIRKGTVRRGPSDHTRVLRYWLAGAITDAEIQANRANVARGNGDDGNCEQPPRGMSGKQGGYELV